MKVYGLTILLTINWKVIFIHTQAIVQLRVENAALKRQLQESVMGPQPDYMKQLHDFTNSTQVRSSYQ